MKIKTKKQMTHEEYAKYMIDKFGIASYERELIDNNIFDAPKEFEQTFTLKSMRKDDDPVIERSFKGVVIEVEEEITEDTKLPKMLLVYDSDDTHFVKGTTIYSLAKSCVKAIHLVNDDLTMTLIWRDGKLVE